MGTTDTPTLFTPDYTTKPVTLLKGPVVSAISLVNKGANKKRFFLFKSEDGPIDNHGFYIDELGNASDPDEFSKVLPLIKAGPTNDEWKTVYCVVAVPGEVDAQKDVWDSETIRSSAHEYLKKSRLINYMHKDLDAVGDLVESAIAPTDMKVGEEYIPKGSWFIAIEPYPEMKKMIETGDITGVSVQGSSKREELTPEASMDLTMSKGAYDSVIVPRAVTQTDYDIPENKEDMQIPDGTEGPGIIMLQNILGIPETGKFDSLTKKAVKEWMSNKGVPGVPTLATIKLILSEGDKSSEKEKAQPKSDKPASQEVAPSPQPADKVQEAQPAESGGSGSVGGQEESMKMWKSKGAIYHFNGDSSKTPLWVKELGQDHVIVEFPASNESEAPVAKVDLNELYKCENPDTHYEKLVKDHPRYPSSFGGDAYNPVDTAVRFPGAPARFGGFDSASYGTHPENLGTEPGDLDVNSSPDTIKAALVRALASGNEILLRHLADTYGVTNAEQVYTYPFTQDELWGLASKYVLGRLGSPNSPSMMMQPVQRADKSAYPDGAGFSMQKVAPFDIHTNDTTADKNGVQVGVGNTVKMSNGKIGIVSAVDLNKNEVHVEKLPLDGSGEFVSIAASKVEVVEVDPMIARAVGTPDTLDLEKGVWSGSHGGYDPEARGKIKYIVRSFGKWARGKQSVAARKLLERGVVKTPEAANRLAAWLKDQWMHSTKWREGGNQRSVKKEDYDTADMGLEELEKAFGMVCNDMQMDPVEIVHIIIEDHHDLDGELDNMFGDNSDAGYDEEDLDNEVEEQSPELYRKFGKSNMMKNEEEMCKACGLRKAECECGSMEKGWMPEGMTQGDLEDGDFAWLSDAYKAGEESATEGRKLPYKIKGKIDPRGWMAAWKAVQGAQGGVDFSGGPTKEETLKLLWNVKPKGVNATPPEGMEKMDNLKGATVQDADGRKWIVVAHEGDSLSVVSGQEKATVGVGDVKVVRQPMGKGDMYGEEMPAKKKPRISMPGAVEEAAPAAKAAEGAPEGAAPEMGEEAAGPEGEKEESAGSRLARLLAAARKRKQQEAQAGAAEGEAEMKDESPMSKSTSALTPEKIDRLRETRTFLENILNYENGEVDEVEDTVSDVETPEVEAVEADFYMENTEVEKDVDASDEAQEGDMSDSVNMNQIVEAINGLGEEVDDILTRVEDLSTLGSKLDHIGDLAKSLDSTERIDVLEKAVEHLTEALGVFTDTLESVDTLNKRLTALETQPGSSTAEAVDAEDATEEVAKSAPADMPLFQRTWGSIF